MSYYFENTRSYCFLVICFSFLFVGCDLNSQQIKTVEKPQDLDSLFSAAIKDAQNPEPSEVYNGLTLIEGNSELIDTMINGEKHILMVSWKAHPEYYPKSGNYNTGGYDIWVTAAPFIQNKCIEYFKTEKDPILRLRQLLGLQPGTVETVFLELWIKPEYLYRPCPDNETNDTKCDLTLPVDVSSDYRQWFNHIRAVQYNDCTDTIYHQYGYPWTQLGYTYDWNPENKSHVGLSEFIIKRNVDVFVRSEKLTKVYCK